MSDEEEPQTSGTQYSVAETYDLNNPEHVTHLRQELERFRQNFREAMVTSREDPPARFANFLLGLVASHAIHQLVEKLAAGEESVEKEIPLPRVPVKELLTTAESGESLAITCAICLDEIDQDAQVYDLRCKHPYHPDCLKRWFNSKTDTHDTCPQDRIPFANYQ